MQGLVDWIKAYGRGRWYPMHASCALSFNSPADRENPFGRTAKPLAIESVAKKAVMKTLMVLLG